MSAGNTSLASINFCAVTFLFCSTYQPSLVNPAALLAAAAVQGINQAQSVLFEVDAGLGDTNFNGEVGNFNIHKELLRIKSNAGGEILDIIPLDQVFRDGA